MHLRLCGLAAHVDAVWPLVDDALAKSLHVAGVAFEHLPHTLNKTLAQLGCTAAPDRGGIHLFCMVEEDLQRAADAVRDACGLAGHASPS